MFSLIKKANRFLQEKYKKYKLTKKLLLSLLFEHIYTGCVQFSQPLFQLHFACDSRKHLPF